MDPIDKVIRFELDEYNPYNDNVVTCGLLYKVYEYFYNFIASEDVINIF